MRQQSVRLCIDFDSKEHMLKWFKDMQRLRTVARTTAVFKLDGADTRATMGGITAGNTYIVRDAQSRPNPISRIS